MKKDHEEAYVEVLIQICALAADAQSKKRNKGLAAKEKGRARDAFEQLCAAWEVAGPAVADLVAVLRNAHRIPFQQVCREYLELRVEQYLNAGEHVPQALVKDVRYASNRILYAQQLLRS